MLNHLFKKNEGNKTKFFKFYHRKHNNDQFEF
jgi:hypothetical protein